MAFIGNEGTRKGGKGFRRSSSVRTHPAAVLPQTPCAKGGSERFGTGVLPPARLTPCEDVSGVYALPPLVQSPTLRGVFGCSEYGKGSGLLP